MFEHFYYAFLHLGVLQNLLLEVLRADLFDKRVLRHFLTLVEVVYFTVEELVY